MFRIPNIQPPIETRRIVAGRENQWRRNAADEHPAPARHQTIRVRMAHREEVPAEAEEEERQRRQPEVGKRADEQQEWRQDGVRKPAAAPGAEDAKQTAQRETEDGRDQSEQQGPLQTRGDDLDDGRGKRADRDPEVAAQRVAQVGHVLLDQRARRRDQTPCAWRRSAPAAPVPGNERTWPRRDRPASGGAGRS